MEDPQTTNSGRIGSDLRARFRQPEPRAAPAETSQPRPTNFRAQPRVPQAVASQLAPVITQPPVLKPIPVPKTETAPQLSLPKINRSPAPVPAVPQVTATPHVPAAVRPTPQPAQSLAPSAADVARSRVPRSRHAKFKASIAGVAALFLIVGLGATIQTTISNRNSAATLAALSAKASEASTITGAAAAIDTAKPSDVSMGQYTVAPDLAKYLKIPKLNVTSRVLQAGVKSNGSLAAPTNVYDTAWYTGSAKPGQTGATLIDGFATNGTTQGVFAAVKTLTPGDTLQIVRGDNITIQYRIVKVQSYQANAVDMQAAITPITAGKPGLNLITNANMVKFADQYSNQRIIVFAEQL